MIRILITILEIKVLRILKPDGHLLWTMKASQEDKSTEFGLFEQNLQVWLSLWEMGLSIESLQDYSCCQLPGWKVS